MTTFYIREVKLETHSYCMGDWFWLDIETIAEKPVFHAVEQRSRSLFGAQEQWGVLVLSDTGEFDRYSSELPPITHRHRIVFVKSHQGMSQSRGGAQKYLGSFICEYGFRWYVFRALPEEPRRAADGTRQGAGALPAGSGQGGGSKKPLAPSQSNGESPARSPGIGQSRGA